MKPRTSQLAKTTRGWQTACALRAQQHYKVATLGIIFDIYLLTDLYCPNINPGKEIFICALHPKILVHIPIK